MRLLLLLLLVACSAVQAQDFRFGKVSKEELQEEAHPLDPEADAAVLYRDKFIRYEYYRNQGFVIETEVYERIKIYNADGFDYATETIGLYQDGGTREGLSGLKAVTYNLVDGKIEETKLKKDGIFEEERTDYLDITKFTMPDIKEGSVIEYKYKISSPFLANIDEIRLQEEIPVNKVNVRLYAPEYFGLKRHAKGWRFVNVVESGSSKTLSFVSSNGGGSGFNNDQVRYTENVYTIEDKDIPAVKEEAYCGNIDNYLSSIKFELAYTKFPQSPIQTFAMTWEDVSKSIYESESFGGELQNGRFFEKDLDPLLAKATSPAEKAVAVFEYAKARMNWNGGFGLYAENGIKKAYKDGSGNSGDINLLLVAMLRYAGLDANPVITSTKSNGIPVFPTRTGFNYVIAGVKLNGGLALMDATNKMGAINVLEDEIINWNGRMIMEDGASQFVSLSPSEPAENKVTVLVNIDDDLKATGKFRKSASGNYAYHERAMYKDTDDDERIMMIEESYQGIEVQDFELKDYENVYKPISTLYNFEAVDVIEEIGGKLYFSPMFQLITDENPFKSEERKYPVDFLYPREESQIVIVNLPEGYVVESVPESLKVALPDEAGHFTFQITATDKQIQLRANSAIKKSMFSPEQYLDLKKFFDMMIAKENEKVVLTKV